MFFLRQRVGFADRLPDFGILYGAVAPVVGALAQQFERGPFGVIVPDMQGNAIEPGMAAARRRVCAEQFHEARVIRQAVHLPYSCAMVTSRRHLGADIVTIAAPCGRK